MYDSKTQKPDETVEDGIDKSLKQVYASLWNFRAFIERDFHRIDHLSAAMGVLVHPNYTDELVNGVAVSEDTIYSLANKYYINSQVGEDLVTNPDAHSIPEEILVDRDGTYEVLITSNQVEAGQLLMTEAQLQQLRRHLGVIHTHFKGQYNPAADEPFAMEIEFKITNADILAIKQARPWVFSHAPASNAAGTVALSSTQPRVDTPLTATLTDPDGVSGATTWAWHRSPDGTSAWAAITGAASTSYTPVTADVGRYLRATASYTDDADNAESLTSAATEAVAAADSLTASFLGVPASHDGSTAFTFELRFSEEIVISYRDFSGPVFQITGGTVQKARRLAPPSNIGWEITVGPTGDDNVVITLPGSRACDVAGAICTSDGDQLYASISATVSGPAPVVPAPVATITPGTTPVAEGAAASFTVSLDGAAPATLSVAVSVADTNGVLSGAAPTSISFAVGDESKTLTLPIRDDNVIKAASTVTVYRLSDGAIQDDLGFELADWSGFAAALWSDGTTMWVADFYGGVHAYRLSDGARQSAKNLDADTLRSAGNFSPSGLRSDGQTMWVADYAAGKVFAYRLSDGVRVAGREFDLVGRGGVPTSPFGLWSDGETLLVTNWVGGGEVLAYDMSGGARSTNRDVDISASDTDNGAGIWSNGETL